MEKTKIFLGSAMAFAGMFFFTASAMAFTIRTGDGIIIPKGETIDGTLVVSGQSVTIDGDVKGDVICAGQAITINGAIDGDVICAGQNVTISNSVAGNVRVVGQALNLGGKIGRNVTVAGQTVKSDSQIQGEMMFASQSAVIGGQVAKSVAGAANLITVSGNIGGDARFRDKNLTVADGASIAGSLDYTSGNEAVLESGSQIAKGVQRFAPPANSKVSVFSRQQETVRQKMIGEARGLIIYLAIALLLIFFFKNQAIKAADLMLAKPGKSFGLGLVFLILVPILAIAFMITIIGIPVALIIALLYAAALLFSRIFAAIAIGRKMVQAYYKSKADSLLAQTLIGVVGLWILFAIPVIGGILSFASVIWGLGGIYYMFKKRKTDQGARS
jgi:cytoskeletal protein CcmA (bactofilin family)